ncbi:MAG: penicillin-binding protein 1C, partial [Saprospiraceae bacterium]|nr:penicillin-binding protein 1C [Saprospiraceae bacterium]
STITQQTIRLARKNQPRSYWEKLKELILATRLEVRYSKKKILQLYSSYAPFGGNVVGLEAASWRYFGIPSAQLSWAESATLAVLPNAPAVVHLDKNRATLLQKRNQLLEKLHQKGEIDAETLRLATLEPLPDAPHILPRHANHLLERLHLAYPGESLNSTIDFQLQDHNNKAVSRHMEQWSANGVNNAAVLVIHIPTRQVVSYVGNAKTEKEHHSEVDIIPANRSTGSLLKPMLYASMLDAGELLPEQILPDIPTFYGSYNPRNFDKNYRGVVNADEALYRSLNVPSVRMLKTHGVNRFQQELNRFGLTNINKTAHYYGLSLILGGAESSLWDLCKVYTSMSSTLTHYSESDGHYFSNEWVDPKLLLRDNYDKGRVVKQFPEVSAASIWQMSQALTEVKRPFEEQTLNYFTAPKRIAWKTGTSFGHRDAWAIGWNQDYLVGVWVGNADGEGRPGLTGLKTAAPLLFDVFRKVPNANWYEAPYEELFPAETCSESGFLAGPNCLDTKELLVGEMCLTSEPCPYHEIVLLTSDGNHRIGEGCATGNIPMAKNYFVLPAAMEWYYKQNNPTYKSLPSLYPGCLSSADENNMSLIYPRPNSEVILPKDLDGEKEKLVMRLAHKKPSTEVFWYVDDEFMGSTTDIHEMEVQPEVGKHLITIVDSYGDEVTCLLTVG